MYSGAVVLSSPGVKEVLELKSSAGGGGGAKALN